MLADVQEFDEIDLDIRYDQLTHRLDITREAGRIKESTNLDFPSIFAFDYDKWKLYHSKDGKPPAATATLWRF